jgi:hypothetical protein
LLVKYKSKAADFYRMKLKELSEKGVSKDGQKLDFKAFIEKPTYDEGRLMVE